MVKVDILALGESLTQYIPRDGSVVIGVNEVQYYKKIDYTILLNQLNEFSIERMELIKKSSPNIAYITAIDLKGMNGINGIIQKLPLIPIMNSRPTIRPDANLSTVYHSQTSPFFALSYALAKLKATDIRIFGADYNTHRHFSGGKKLETELLCWAWILKEAREAGVKIEIPETSKLYQL